MKKHVSRITQAINRLLDDSRFFVFSIALFGMHTFWLALSAHSLPFDEYFHIGVIRLFSHQWLPFISKQAAEVSYLGDLTRLPSYLYHYLMSFPYRFFAIFIDNQNTLMIIMRCLNIGLVVGGLILWRKFLLKLGLSRRLVHFSLFIFMMLPMVVLVAAESNYDNLLFLITPIFLTFGINIAKGSGKVTDLAGFIIIGLLSCLVKNQFIVIFGIGCLVVGYAILIHHKPKLVAQKLKLSLVNSSRLTLTLLAVGLALSIGLFVERYGYNLVRYQSLKPDCAKVQSFEVCYQNSPWQRNFNTRQTRSPDELFGNPVSFSMYWFTNLMRGFVANFANVPQVAQPWDPYGTYKFKPLLPLMIGSAYTALVMVVIAGAISFKRWWRIYWLRLSFIFIISYMTMLWLFNYSSYLQTGQPYAAQARYLYPLLILLLTSGIKVISIAFKARQWLSWLAALVILIFIYSGGAFGWFVYADHNWYLPNSTNIKVNQSVQEILRKTIWHNKSRQLLK